MGGVAWSHFPDLKSEKNKDAEKKKDSANEIGQEAKLYKTSKFCMIFVALIPVMNYNAQVAFKRGLIMTAYGYARVSTNGQDLSSQEAELMAAGCAKVFKEKVSGAKTDRAELTKAIR